MHLVKRCSAQAVCGLGVVQMFFATALTVCGFISLGLFQNISCIGIWLGLPMLIPGIFSIVVLGTRKRCWCIMTIITSLIIFAVSLYHVYALNDHALNYWQKYRKLSEQLGRPVCYNRGDRCECTGYNMEKAGYRVQHCSMFRVGEDLFWTMLVFTVGALLFSLVNVVVAAWAACTKAPKQIGA